MAPKLGESSNLVNYGQSSSGGQQQFQVRIPSKQTMAASPILIPNRSVIKEEKDLQTIDAVSNMNKSNYSAHTYEPLKPIESVINPSSNVTPKYP